MIFMINKKINKKEQKKLYNYNSYKNEKAPYAEKDNNINI